MDPILDFTGLTVLITGAGSGFGAALSREMASRGAALVLADINADGLQETLEAVQQNGASAVHLVGDISKEPHSRELVELAQSCFDSLHIAVNNAGLAPNRAPINQLEESVLDKQFEVNVKGVAFGLKYQLPAISQAGGGAVLNVSSVAGIGGAPLASSYAAAKHAVIGLTKTAAFEFASKNVRVNAICPFYTPTPMVTDIVKQSGGEIEDINRVLAQGCPMKRIATVDEIVTVMLMMLSPKNTYMNGIAVPVDGGVSAL